MNKFTIKKEHLLLLQNLIVVWNDGDGPGAPGINTKKPYGNSGVENDIAEISLWKLRDGELSEAQEVKAIKLHSELKTVLSICLSTLSFAKGTYKLIDTFPDKWIKTSK